MSGRLTLVGTPIGNLEDISRRAIRALAEADVVYCEDTRRARQLYAALGIKAPPLHRLDSHTEASVSARLAETVVGGAAAVFVSDAGMPTISDPGALAVRAVVDAGGRVEVVPGPDAVSVALAVSGLPADRFRFFGFLPRKGRDRASELASVAACQCTAVIYEAPTRVRATVADLGSVCRADRPFVAARELTKLHEEVWRGTLGGASAWLEGEEPRGEWVLMVAGEPAAPVDHADEDVETALRDALAAGADRRTAVAEVTSALGLPRRRVYELSLRLPR